MSKDEPHIFVVTSDGEFLNYKIDFYHGGEGRLEKQYSYFLGEMKLMQVVGFTR